MSNFSWKGQKDPPSPAGPQAGDELQARRGSVLGHVHSQCWISEAWSSSRASPGAAPPSEGPAGSAGSVLLSPPSPEVAAAAAAAA